MMNLPATSSPNVRSKQPLPRSPLSPHFTSRNPLLGFSSSFVNDKGTCVTRETHSPAALSSSCETCRRRSVGMNEMLASLALMCLLSLLTAFLALFFMQKTSPLVDSGETPESPDTSSSGGSSKSLVSHSGVSQTRLSSYNRREHLRVSQISLSLSTLTISLNLSCLFVCCIQFLSAAKLLKTQQGVKRAGDFFKKTSHVRTAAIGAFLMSIPIFFTGIILFNFVTFDDTPALATVISLVIGLVIVFCGLACVQAVYLWQVEKTKATQEINSHRLSQNTSVIPILELSTLV